MWDCMNKPLWHTCCCMFHTGLCSCFGTFKNTVKSIWTLKPVAHCCCHEAIMSLLLFFFFMNLLARWWWWCHEKKKSIFGLLKMETNNKRRNAWNSTGLRAFSFSFVFAQGGRWDTWNTQTAEQWKGAHNYKSTHTLTNRHTHTHMEGFWTLITHLGRSGDYLWSSAVRNPSPPPHLAPSSLPPSHSLLRCH